MRQSLPYPERLGVTAILMTPLYPGRVYHKYLSTDFEDVDPRYGTRADLKESGWVEPQRPPCCQDKWMAEVGELKRGRE